MTRPQHQQIGRQRQTMSLLSPGQQAGFLLVGLVLSGALLWHLTIVLTAGVPFSEPNVTFRALLKAKPLAGLPAPYERPSGGSALMVFGGLMLGAITVVYAVLFWLSGRRKKGIVGMATKSQTRQSAGELRARERARHPRQASIARGLDVDTCPLEEVAIHLADTSDTHEPVVVTLEDQIGVYAPTGAGKSLRVVIPLCLDAPGPLVATSTRPEILDAIVEHRAGRGQIWVFDPLDRAGWPEPMIWNPVNGAQDSELATGRGLAFAAGCGAPENGGNSQFFQTAAGIIIARLLHAAALSGANMVDVITWAMDISRSTVAQDILKQHPDAEILWGETLAAQSEGADDTVASTRQTLAQKIEPILSRKVLRQMLPRDGVREFDPAAFVQSRDTLILITDDNAASNVAPLTTMLLDEVLNAAKSVASRSISGFLDPPMRIVGDEVCNVAPLPKLPKVLSDSRGYGVQWAVIFQSFIQIVERWGASGAKQMAGNLQATIVMGGLQDDEGLERFSKLVGSGELQRISATLDTDATTTSRTLSMDERQLLRVEEIRKIPDGQALLIYRNAEAMIVNLTPWTARPDAAAIRAAITYIRDIRINKALS